MIFNSFEFAIFLPLVFIAYWFLLGNNRRLQNLFLVAASFLFYGWWDWRFLFLLILSAGIDFFVGIQIGRTSIERKRKQLLLLSIFSNLGILGFFKYYNFFVDNFTQAFTLFGSHFEPYTLRIILPVGISFYTFQALSYTVDVYRRKLKPVNDPVAYFAFISFFPQLVAGPIERATHLLPQFFNSRKFNYQNAVLGMQQILWGLFKKVVIADNCGKYVDLIFSNHTEYSGSTLLLGGFLFAFQIYGDFSGYSDIALGTSRLFGFDLMNNFKYPYFSKSIAEFWRRWHISLSTWFRDYVYVPLGGSRGTKAKTIRNVFIIFIVSGFWHGANWTFIVWGIMHAILFLPSLLKGTNKKTFEEETSYRMVPSLRDFFSMGLTFFLVTLAWIVFRSDNIEMCLSIYAKLFSSSLFSTPYFLGISNITSLGVLIMIFIAAEWLGRRHDSTLFLINTIKYSWLKNAVYWTIALVILLAGNFENNEFIYFQF